MNALERLIKIFQNMKVHYSETEFLVVRKIRMELISLCSTSSPIQIRHSASKCLGYFFHQDVELSNESFFDADSTVHAYEVMDSTLPSFHDDPLTHINILALRLLAEYVQSHDIDLAIISIDTIYAVIVERIADQEHACGQYTIR